MFTYQIQPFTFSYCIQITNTNTKRGLIIHNVKVVRRFCEKLHRLLGKTHIKKCFFVVEPLVQKWIKINKKWQSNLN